MAFPRQEYWGGLPFPSPGDSPNPGIKPMSPASPALAGGFFYHWAKWEAHRNNMGKSQKHSIEKRYQWASKVVLVVKNPPAKVGDVRDAGSVAKSRIWLKRLSTHTCITCKTTYYMIPFYMKLKNRHLINDDWSRNGGSLVVIDWRKIWGSILG